MRLFIFIIILFVSGSCFSQTRSVSGIIVDSTSNPLLGVTVNLKSTEVNLYTKTNSLGKFYFTNISSVEFTITISSIGFENFIQTYKFSNSTGEVYIIDPVKLKLKTHELAEIVIIANPITIKEDTIEYRANAFKVGEGALVEDVLRKLPGVTVDKDGVVMAQGEEVKRVRVNGKDYFGGDVITATQNLPADIVENIQIINDYGDKANLTGIKDGDPEKVLNINVQKGKNKGSFGNSTLAAGTERRYLGKISANNFKEETQLSFLGSLNNTNANTFSFNGGGGASGANFGSIGRGGGADGITYSTSFGLNYRDVWGKKITSYGSYSYSSIKNNTTASAFQQDFNTQDINSTRRVNENNSNTYNHRVTWNLEYKMDSLNYLKVTPYISYASSKHINNGISEFSKPRFYTLNNGKFKSATVTPDWGTDLFYNHKFRKRGRNLNVQGTINHSAYDQEREVINEYHNVDSTFFIPRVNQTNQYQLIENNNINTTTNLRFSFTEQLGKYSVIEGSYGFNNSNTKSIRDVDDVDQTTGEKVKNTKQSTNYDYQFTTNRIGVSVYTNQKKYNYLFGIVSLPSMLTGVDKGREIITKINDFNIAPTARFTYKFSRNNSLTASFGGTNRQPSFIQLQPVKDSSDIKNIVTGNPFLKAEFINRFRLQYNKADVLTGRSFFTSISFDKTENKIVSSRVNEANGTGRSTTYLNANGFYGINGKLSASQPFVNKNLAISFIAYGAYDNNISFTDNQKNSGHNWTISPGAVLRINFPDLIDANIKGIYTYNKNTTRYPTYIYSSEVNTLDFGVEGKNYFLKNWIFGYDFTKIIYTGFLSTFNTNPTLLNLYLEHRIFNKNGGSIRIHGYDLFNQNTGISRIINGTTITDVQNNRLGRYFLLSFNFRLKKFVGK